MYKDSNLNFKYLANTSIYHILFLLSVKSKKWHLNLPCLFPLRFHLHMWRYDEGPKWQYRIARLPLRLSQRGQLHLGHCRWRGKQNPAHLLVICHWGRVWFLVLVRWASASCKLQNQVGRYETVTVFKVLNNSKDSQEVTSSAPRCDQHC